MPWYPNPFNYYGTSPTQVRDDLDKANANFAQLASAFVNNDPTSGVVNNADNADKVDGYHASQTPSANTIPVAGSNGKLAVGWLFITTYSNYSVSSTAPSNPARGDIYFNTSNKKLYIYNGNWEEIEWTSLIQATPEFQIGRLRINSTTGYLEISPDGTSWYPCYPLIGANVFNIKTLDNQNYTYKYYLPPGATATLEGTNHIPIVYANNLNSQYEIQMVFVMSYGAMVGVYPSNIAISDGFCTLNTGWTSGTIAIVGFCDTDASRADHYTVSFVNIFNNGVWQVLGFSQGYQGVTPTFAWCVGTASSSSFWLGTLRKQDSQQFTANYVTITHRR